MLLSAEDAGAIFFGKVTDNDNLFVSALETGLDAIQQVDFAVLEKSTEGEGAKRHGQPRRLRCRKKSD